MTRPSPTPQAADRLRDLGDKQLLAFLNEVTNKTKRELLGILPSVDGFRKDSAASLPTRKQTLLRHYLKKAGAPSANKSRADTAYYYLWRAWAEQHLKDVDGLGTLLDAIEKATINDHPQVAADQAQSEIEALFRSLHEQSFLNRCAAETIERLLRFSPFESTEVLERLVSGAKPLVAVDRDRALSQLPDRLQGDEELLTRLRDDLETLSGEVSRLAEAVGEVSARPTAPVDDGSRSRALEDALAELQRLRNEVEAQDAGIARAGASIDARLKAMEGAVADLEALWGDVAEQSGKQAEEFGRRLADLAERGERVLQSSEPVQGVVVAAATSTPTLRLVALQQSPGTAKALATGAEAVGLLASNYAALGLKSSSAAAFSEEVLTAAVTGRVVFFKGSFSTELARSTAMALAGERVVRTRIPLGVPDGATLDADVVSALGERGGTVGALLMERINNAPLELLADAIADITRENEIVVLATLADGVSTLPEQPLYLQLGPVFDTDVLEWSVFPKANTTVVAGALASLDPKRLAMQQSSGKPRTEELLELLRLDGSFRNPRMERSATAFMSTLEAFRTANAPTSLQSTAYGWVWPLWRMVGTKLEDIEEELDGGRIDGEDQVDSRLKLLLELAGAGGS